MTRPSLLHLRACAAALVTVAACGAGTALAAARGVPSASLRGASPAGASITTVVTDPDDTAGPLDIARVRHRITQRQPGHVRISYGVRTFGRFPASALDRSHRHFVLELNRDGQPGSERNVRISSRAGELVAEVISNSTREVITTVTAVQLNSRAFRIFGPREVLGARSYFWFSNFHAPRSLDCGSANGYPITCQDAVPERGWIRLDRPAWPVSG